MRVDVFGDKPHNENVTFDGITDAVNFMIDRLFHHDDAWLVVAKLELDIEVYDGLFEESNNDGLMWPAQEQKESGFPTSFEMQLDSSLTFDVMMKTIGHELAHVRQRALGHFVYDKDTHITRWNGQIIDVDAYEYHDLPWETDAHGCEYGLYSRYVQFLKGEYVPPSKQIAHAKLLIPNLNNLYSAPAKRHQ